MIAIPHPPNNAQPVEDMDIPGSPISLHSRFYIERPPIEALAYTEIRKPGSLIRIRSPKKTGKSSLIFRLINQAVTFGYRTVTIDFQQADTAIFESSDKFLRWLCLNVARQLELAPNLDDYWDEEMGNKVSCTIYFQKYLLKQISGPLVLVLHEVNQIFEYPHIARDFFPLLRFLHEQARQRKIWQKLRLVLVHSTEIYVSLSINQSPFNVGLALKLPGFTFEQVQILAQRYGLNLSEAQIEQLTNMVGGHPYLVHQALYHLFCYNSNLEKLLQEAPTQAGIYSDHLRDLWLKLQKEAELVTALQHLFTSKSSIPLDTFITYKLDSLGIIKSANGHSIISCDLYRIYFQNQTSQQANSNALSLENLQQENQKLHSLVYLDPVTQIANRRQFDDYLKIEWERMSREAAPLSLIICDIDYFQIYNEIYGLKTGDNCLRQVAQAICQVVKCPGDLVARYGSDEFVIVLPRNDAAEAVNIAETVRIAIKEIGLHLESNKVGGLPDSVVTLSLGVASTIPHHNDRPESLLLEADKALYQSKRQGCNRVTLSTVLNCRYKSEVGSEE